MKIDKGDFGYIKRQKLVRLLKTLAFFLLPVALLIVGLVFNHGDRKNIYTVIAMVGCIPACMSAVSMIMMWMQKPMRRELYQEISPHAQGLTMAYELCLTTQEKNLFLDAVAIHGESILAYTDRETSQKNLEVMEDHIRRTLRVENYKVTVKILDPGRRKAFLDRLDTWKKQTEGRKDAKADKKNAGVNQKDAGVDREETAINNEEVAIREILLAISL